MCAINGIVDTRGRSTQERVRDDAIVRDMNAATAHRGPDGTGHWSDTFASLGHNRLAIIDLSAAANQPMTSVSGRFTIIFNGEIYNYRELKKELSSYPFATSSDTEVILAAFERWGTDCFARLRGMFGLAIWDSEKKELTLARDQSGIKPVYFSRTPGRVAFSSELKGILADKTIVRKIDRDALESYLRLRYVPEPLTMIEGVSKLPPGSYSVIRGEEFTITQYFTVPLAPLLLDPKEKIEKQVERLIDDAVKAELVSDRPVGLFLSGGIDSTIVLDAATRAAGIVETFSLRFDVSADESPEKFNADADLALQSAAFYKTKHHETLLSEEEFVRLLPEAMRFLDQPIANPTAIAQLFLSREARTHIVVALTGDGGDELFGGYPRYRFSRLMDIYQYLPKFMRTIANAISPDAKKLDTPPGIERIERFLFEKDAMLARAVAPEYISSLPADRFEKRYLTGRGEHDFTQLFMDADRRSWLVDEALARTDVMTMAASLEARVPLLNTALVLYAARIPAGMRAGLFGGKKILRDAFRARLPRHVLDAEKRGWFSPTAKWLRRPQALALAREVLSPGYHPATDALLNFPGVQKMLEDHVAKKGYALPTLWTIITLRMWAKIFDATL
jgi:asparagine synthase (glutamine-hydrolysing)